jgi:hypothetical protein
MKGLPELSTRIIRRREIRAQQNPHKPKNFGNGVPALLPSPLGLRPRKAVVMPVGAPEQLLMECDLDGVRLVAQVLWVKHFAEFLRTAERGQLLSSAVGLLRWQFQLVGSSGRAEWWW